jgi:hypothetical protein
MIVIARADGRGRRRRRGIDPAHAAESEGTQRKALLYRAKPSREN